MGQYTQQLIRHLPLADPDDEYVAWYLHARGLFRPRRFFADVRARNLTEKASRFPAQGLPARLVPTGRPAVGVARSISTCSWRRTSWPPRPIIPIASCPVVHDLAFQHFPESAPHIDERWRGRFAATLAEAPAIIVPSASTAMDLRDVVRGRRERGCTWCITVSRRRRSRRSRRPPSTPSAAGYGIPGPYVLFVGGIEPRKNLEHLVRAFAMSDARPPLAGARGRAGALVPGGDRAAGRGDPVAPGEREGADRAHRTT